MPYTCKVCGEVVDPRHVIQNIPYYYCPSCHLLQNFYWDEQPTQSPEQIKVNDQRREERWPAGEREYMHELGWHYLELIAWPIAWHSRRLHKLLAYIPGYKQLVRAYIKRRLRRLLDFGCGHGISVLELRSKDKFDIIGLDPFSPTQSPHILRQTLQEASLPADSLDAIFTIETMEHIPDILPVFKQLNRILKPGGTLLVQTNRLEHPDYLRQKEKWFYLEHPQTHVTIYSEPALRRIAQKTGFSSIAFHGPRLARLTK